jgi:hypothetical protein
MFYTEQLIRKFIAVRIASVELSTVKPDPCTAIRTHIDMKPTDFSFR